MSKRDDVLLLKLKSGFQAAATRYVRSRLGLLQAEGPPQYEQGQKQTLEGIFWERYLAKHIKGFNPGEGLDFPNLAREDRTELARITGVSEPEIARLSGLEAKRTANARNARATLKKAEVHLATGGEVPDQPQASDYQPQGTDTQPARLPEGAFVLNRESTQANPELVRELGGTTVPSDPGRVADFPAGKQAAELTPGEKVIAPEVAAAHPDLVQEVNAAHGPVKHLAGGGNGADDTSRKYTTYDLAPPSGVAPEVSPAQPLAGGEEASKTDERAHVDDVKKLDEQVKGSSPTTSKS